jgi:hypothetical protein
MTGLQLLGRVSRLGQAKVTKKTFEINLKVEEEFQGLALTTLTSGGRSVGIVRLRYTVTEFSLEEGCEDPD